MLPQFVKYAKTHNLDYESICNAANSFSLKFYKKGDFIFHQLEDSDAFYGVISGQVSLQNETYQYEDTVKEGYFKLSKYKVNLKAKRPGDDKYVLKEDVSMICERGYCFGEWGLVMDMKRTNSAKAIEDSLVFVLPKKDFKASINHCFAKVLIDRKLFIRDVIQPFIKYNMVFDRLAKHITPIVIYFNIVSR